MLKPWYLPHATVYRAPTDGDGGDGGGGGDEGKGEEDKEGGEGKAPISDPRLDTLENAVRLMAQGQASLNETIQNLSKGFETLSAQRNEPEKNEKADDEDVDLETMDRKSFAAHLTNKLKGIMDESLKPLGDKFGKLDEKIDAHGLSAMIKDFQKDHPDFFEWKPEMQQLLRENPTLTPARAYALVRTENGDKAKQMDKKYGLNKPASSGKNGTESLLSLFPSGSSSATKGSAKMTPQQAAEAAWDQVMSQIGERR